MPEGPWTLDCHHLPLPVTGCQIIHRPSSAHIPQHREDVTRAMGARLVARGPSGLRRAPRWARAEHVCGGRAIPTGAAVALGQSHQEPRGTSCRRPRATSALVKTHCAFPRGRLVCKAKSFKISVKATELKSTLPGCG